MAVPIGRAALAALITCASVAGAAGAGSQFCTEAGGKKRLGFGVKPAMVVHDDTMVVTFAEAGLADGPGDQKLFAFGRTVDALLRSAGEIEAATPAAEVEAKRRALVGTLLASFHETDGVMVNPRSGLLLPVDDRSTAEGALSAAALLDPVTGMQPRALFNRFDAAPQDWAHCGEYRIVYTLPHTETFNRRLLLIFEAAVPNPGFVPGDADRSEAGCRPMAEFWAGLPADGAGRVARATALSGLYYEGVEGVTAPMGSGNDFPVISFRNLGGDGGRGQVRANMFHNGPWQLREWLTQRTASGLAFVEETVKDNPAVEFYRDSLAGQPIAAANISALLDQTHAGFVSHFMTELGGNLMIERSPKFRDLVNGLGGFDLADVDGDRILVTLMALGADDRFNEFQSVSQGAAADEPTRAAGPVFRRMLGLLNGRSDQLEPAFRDEQRSQSVDVLLARAEAATCAGCHQTAPRTGITPDPLVVKVRADGSPLHWPDVVADGAGFVHVHEDGQLSPALEDNFLPVRRYMMGTHLCRDLAVGAAGAAADATPFEPVDPYYGDAIVASFLPNPPPGAAQDASGTGMALRAAPEAVRAQATEALAAEIRVRREVERSKPGAFVEVRRPH